MELPKRYHYNPSPPMAILGLVFFGLGILLFSSKAQHNDRGLILWHLIEFGPGGATMFYWVLTVVSGLFSLMGLILLVRTAVFPRFLELGDEVLTLPAGYLHLKSSNIRYSDVEGLWETRFNFQTILTVVLSNGQRYHMTRSMFEDAKYYEEVRDFLASRSVGNEFCPASR
ncbi:hypothetical protein DES53_109146 [Roseimicrobium gellanilyticum]|uniref:PH (Pleckstrin Homology) domain-containing protein n=2 Tax=Roseimicrobium gellanilyticum TaxID=748857 RepID=A0A366HD05_9BACT|nr:hypothetical protein DES53_109146 [Roseimicrobium gellanilyticum]